MEETSYSIQGLCLLFLLLSVFFEISLNNRRKEHRSLNLAALYSQNGILAGVYPASPSSWLIVVIAMMTSLYIPVDPSVGMIDTVKESLPYRSESFWRQYYMLSSCC